MPDVHQVYLKTESYYFGHQRLPSDMPVETTGTGSLESPYVPVSSPILKAEVTLANANIIALPSTGFQLVATPGASKMINVLSCTVVSNFTAIYTFAANTSLNLLLGGTYLNGPFINWSSALGSTQRKVCFLITHTMDNQTAGGFAGEVTGSIIENLTNVADKPLLLKDDYTGVANYGGGNAANTLKVTTYYTIIDL